MSNHSKIIDQTLLKLGFHGSYRPEDVTFLMQVDDIQPTDVEEKEYLIQSGKMHYSQMISVENPPTEEHMKHFHHAFEQGALRLAEEVQKIGNSLLQRFAQQPIILISLVRAGVPLGVLLKHYLSDQRSTPQTSNDQNINIQNVNIQNHEVHHYGISIIRDRGIDFAALQAIIEQHGAENIVFVDGWTGKGAICKELTQNLLNTPELFDENWPIPRLVTLSDLGGFSWLSASTDDWLVPFGILGSVISGLTSRTILKQTIDRADAQADCYNPQKWHSCLIYNHLQPYDLSVDFIEKILKLIKLNPVTEPVNWNNQIRLTQQQSSSETIAWIAEHYSVENINRIKASIAEATRAVLRRVPERILLHNDTDPNVQLLLHFAHERNIPVEILGSQLGPYQAVTLIKKVEKK